MSSGRICFDSNLLSGTDGNSVFYQWDVAQLTGGEQLTPENPCVPSQNLPASFVLNGFDPKRPDQLDGYLKHRPYYQTAACLMENAKRFNERIRPTEPWEADVIPMSIDPKKWGQNPKEAIQQAARETGHNYSEIVSTLAYIATDLPQTDPSRQSILKYLSEHGRRCADFALVEIHYQSSDPLLKRKIAEELLKRFRPHHNNDGPFEWTPLKAELWASLYPVFVDFFEHEVGKQWERADAARAIVETGGMEGQNYLVHHILSGGDGREEAVGGLLGALYSPFDVIPSLQKILEQWGKNPYAISAGKSILKKINVDFQDDERFLAPIHAILVKEKGDVEDIRDNLALAYQSLLNYMAGCGSVAVPYLADLATRKDVNFSDNFRQNAIEALAEMKDGKAMAELKKMIKDGNEQAIRILSKSENPLAHRTLLELVDETAGDVQKNVIEKLGLLTKDPDTAQAAFKKIAEIRQKLSVEDTVLDRFDIRSALERLGKTYLGDWSDKFHQFSPYEQELLIDIWSVNPWTTPDLYRTVKTTPGIKPEQVRRVEDRMVETVDGVLQPPEIWLDTILADDFYPFSLKKRFLAKKAEGSRAMLNLEIFAQDSKLPRAIRREAILAMALVSPFGNPDIEKTLSDKVKDDSLSHFLRIAAADALKERAKNPAYKEASLAALKSCLCPPPAIQEHIRKGLRD